MISAFSMSRSLVLRFAPRFFLLRVSALLLVYLRRMLLHRVSIRTLDELSSGQLGAGWGSRGVDAAISQPVSLENAHLSSLWLQRDTDAEAL
jgi:hypothetical protein